MTITTTTMPVPGQSICDPAEGNYAGYLDMLRYVTDRETAAQTLEAMAAEAIAASRRIRASHLADEESPAPAGAREERIEALAVLASDGWQRDALAWAETATLLTQLASAMRGYTPEFAESDDNYGWPRNEWEILALAWTPQEFAAAFSILRAELEELTTLPAIGEREKPVHDYSAVPGHPDALARLVEAAAAIASAPWG